MPGRKQPFGKARCHAGHHPIRPRRHHYDGGRKIPSVLVLALGNAAARRYLARSVQSRFSCLTRGAKRLKAGGIATIAPEGRRSPNAQMLPGKPGAAYLAAKANVPIVPIGVTGTEESQVYSRLRRLRRLDIKIRVGEPFQLPPMPRQNRDEFLQQSTDEIMCRIAMLLPPNYRGVYATHPRLSALLGENRDWRKTERSH